MIHPVDPLSWDSDFFGFPIGKIQLDNPNFDLGHVNNSIIQSPFKLVYCFVANNAFSRQAVNEQITNALWVDGKTTYKKNVTIIKGSDLSENIRKVKTLSDQVLHLAKGAGIYSRFALDKNFTAEACAKLYVKWIEQSVTNKYADEVFGYYNEEGRILGFLTVNRKMENLQLGLLSVDTETRGLGIATKLIRQAEHYANQHNFPMMELDTQENNHTAQRVFVNYGFMKEDIVDVYHVWK